MQGNDTDIQGIPFGGHSGHVCIRNLPKGLVNIKIGVHKVQKVEDMHIKPFL